MYEKKGLTHTIVSCRHIDLKSDDHAKQFLKLVKVFFNLRNELSNANVQFHFDRLSLESHSILVSISSPECELFKSFLRARGFAVSVLGETEHALSPLRRVKPESDDSEGAGEPDEAAAATVAEAPAQTAPGPGFVPGAANIAHSATEQPEARP